MAMAARRNTEILQPINDSVLRAAVIDAVGRHEIPPEEAAWSELDNLSINTVFDGLEAVPEGIFTTGNDGFEAVATVYVELNYGNDDDAVRATETFPANVKGHFDNGNAIIDQVEIDTTAFYS